jgi:asparagine synthase (glutamine-hydrolysing)
MCGIWASAGIAVPEAAIGEVAHRGPDGQGWRSFATAAGPVHLGHRLLAISGFCEGEGAAHDGRQPMAQPPGRRWLTYNGEIYRREALRSALTAAGVDAPGRTDTALVLAALGAWGVDAFERLEGMFALACYDADAGRLLVARDRFGIKPLYVLRTAHGIAFASEIKQFLPVPGFRPRLNEARARDFLDLGLTDHTCETLWRDVGVVPPGTAIIADIGPDGALRIGQRCWYEPPPARPGRGSAADRTARFAEALRLSIREHVPREVSAGISLSGGLDSSALACLAPVPLPCFSLVHDDPAVDESRFARSVTRHLASPWIPVRLEAAELPAAVAAAVRSLDEPFPSLSVVAQWAVFRAARRQGVRVLLTGQGADELLGGYPFLLGTQLATLLRAGRWRVLASEIRAQRRLYGHSAGFLLRSLATAVAPAALLARMTQHGWADPGLSRARLAVRRGGARDEAARGLGSFRRQLLGPANLAMLLRYEDRTAMAHGVESRPPFLDHRVVEAALALGGDELIVRGISKHPLRALARSAMPPDVLGRLDKRGFPTPETAWLKGPLRGYVLQQARRAHERFPELVCRSALAAVAAVLDEPGPLRAPVWRIGALGAWAEEFGVAA